MHLLIYTIFRYEKNTWNRGILNNKANNGYACKIDNIIHVTVMMAMVTLIDDNINRIRILIMITNNGNNSYNVIDHVINKDI